MQEKRQCILKEQLLGADLPLGSLPIVGRRRIPFLCGAWQAQVNLAASENRVDVVSDAVDMDKAEGDKTSATDGFLLCPLVPLERPMSRGYGNVFGHAQLTQTTHEEALQRKRFLNQFGPFPGGVSHEGEKGPDVFQLSPCDHS